ncbi:MAG: mechanosensitive ion channel family protein, partial [Anaerolineaceae bacterium]|nr:mechanosensitive ion channel family protein [Anaerolineaceae bacterium]
GEKSVSLTNLLVRLTLQTRGYFILMTAVYLGSLLLQLPQSLRDALRVLMVTISLLQVGFWLNNLIDYWINRRIRQELDQDNTSVNTLSGLGLIGRILIWVVLILLILENVTGIKVTTLVASLGITGIVVALATQNILSDLFASLSITLDRPFVIGDSIIVGEFNGKVEHIGLKSTRIRSINGEQLVFSNSDLLNSRIRNYKRMERRRVVFSLDISYQTPANVIERIPDILREIISERPQIGFDRAHFREFRESALYIEVVYFVENPDYVLFMDTQHSINLAILRRFGEEGIEFAYPTQTIYVSGANGQVPIPPD